MSAAPDDYKFLGSLMGGWFHQDFDIVGDTPEEIIAAYKLESSQAERDHIQQDIRRFLAQHPDDHELTKEFTRLFEPDLIERPWGLTTRQFLTRITELLT